MKALLLSDLHINISKWFSESDIENLRKRFTDLTSEDYDVVLITGDVFEHTVQKQNLNPYDLLNRIFPGKHIIFCLGNHEFAYMDYQSVLDYYSKFNHELVHCLDVEGHYILNDINFVGNVFWYDFTGSKSKEVMKGEIVDFWLDSTIKNFDPIKANKDCKKKIKKNLSKDTKNVLMTHTCPHWKLNTFAIKDQYDLYNYYSGCWDFLKNVKDYPIEYSLCGHTHTHEAIELYGIKCINLGNDYFHKTYKVEFEILEI